MAKIILTEQDIINTYNERQQEQCKLYYQYKKIKQQNQTFGYKKIAKLLGQPYGKTRWWHSKKHIPTPIQTANWLKEKGLIPLTQKNSKIHLIAKVLGTTFGDGGVFQNLNAIFLSSSELEAVKEFGEDLKLVFGNEIKQNSRIIEGEEYGHSWCYQNTNRKIIRFFQALGAPIGKKTNLELKLPNHIKFREKMADEFFGAFFGSEINIPKIHISETHLDTLSIGFTGPPHLNQNRIAFLLKIKKYLGYKGVITGSITKTKNKNKRREDSFIFKLHVSTKLNNVKKFKERIKIHYCFYKKDKLDNTIAKFIELKRKRYRDLILMNYNENAALNLLKIDQIDKDLIIN